MPTLQITLPEPLQQFVQGRVAELGLDRPDQYFEQLLEEERLRLPWGGYEKMVGEALDADRWTSVPEGKWNEFWDGIHQKAKQLREARPLEAAK